MITLIYGAKGSGKTKRIIDSANTALETCKGNIIYVTDNAKHSIEIKPNIRFIDSLNYSIASEEGALGFIKGILASDNDIANVYIDGIARIAKTDINNLEKMFNELDKLAVMDKVNFIITVSAEVLPAYLKKYI